MSTADALNQPMYKIIGEGWIIKKQRIWHPNSKGSWAVKR